MKISIELDQGDQVWLTIIESNLKENGFLNSAAAITRILDKYAEAVKDEMKEMAIQDDKDDDLEYKDIPGFEGTKEQLDNLGLS